MGLFNFCFICISNRPIDICTPAFSASSTSTGSDPVIMSSPSSSSSVNPGLDQTVQASFEASKATTGETLSSGESSQQNTTTNLEKLSPMQLSKSPESTLPFESTEDAVKEEYTLEEYQAHIRLGDYSGKVYNDLKNIAKRSKLPFPRDCAEWAEAIGFEYDDKTVSSGGLLGSFHTAADKLLSTCYLPKRASWRAVQHYADRNQAVHSKAGILKTVRAWNELYLQISRDLAELESFLPDSFKDTKKGSEEHSMEDHMDIIRYYRDSVAEWMKENHENVIEPQPSLPGISTGSNTEEPVKSKWITVGGTGDLSVSRTSSPDFPAEADKPSKRLSKFEALTTELESLDPQRCDQTVERVFEIFNGVILQKKKEGGKAKKDYRRESRKKGAASNAGPIGPDLA
ncbi:hypothetical protein ONS95_001962 [Cadophora gregata]|uniref:uncharacterized protein n=1 Tax=Cadophora gregata TaxID=51156 RepID=UPI0026DB80D5|nr:uncharacterized protein ONS95_001962 [Cadophora gregata]KAK0111616.1 hypothetical protein ONS95_001962 [Cadophora gregata]KAK0111908.1 hypothetical protein ONS96_001175 [Cadophora gregata f. sp. sojae]